MFKGYSEEFKNKLEKNNQNSEDFCFCVYDLEESSDRQPGENKFDILSPELRQKLGNIITSNGGTMSNPRGIRFLSLPTNLVYYGTKTHSLWISINKQKLTELANSSSSRIIEFPTQGFKFCAVSATTLACKLKVSDNSNFHQILDWVRDKDNSVSRTRKSAFSQIDNAFSENHIGIETAEIFWPEILPNWCSCEIKEIGNETNNSLYEHHIKSCLWREESEIKTFKDKMLEAIRQGGKRFNDYKNQIIQQIIKKAKDQNIIETELNTTRPNWQNTLRSLKNRKEITDYQTNQLEKDIEKLVEAKNKSAQEREQAENETQQNAQKEEERLKKEREEREKKEEEERKQKEKKEAEEKDKKAKEQAKKQELNQQRDKTITEIITALNQEPQITNSELSPQYQNWETQIIQLTDIQQITNLQERLLADIQARRKEKETSQKVKQNLNKLQTGTPEEKKTKPEKT